MATDRVTLDHVLTQVQRLSPQDRVLLIQRVAETLLPETQMDASPQLTYGMFRDTDRPMSTEEDFRLAEWHPSGEEFDGP